ncbi:MAG: adenine phosphoribosyltransferase [Cyclobacteriaceae bacterium]
MTLADEIKSLIRDVPDFPRPGIIFKDMTPLLESPKVVKRVVDGLAAPFAGSSVNAVTAIEARGFLFGFLLAQILDVPFIPVRKKGKLPYKKISQEYSLEYGSAEIEIHEDAIQPGWKVLVHDDLLATGGTADAAAKLVQKLKGEVAGFSFVVDLAFLGGSALLQKQYNCKPETLIQY